MKARYFLRFSYIGTQFRGAQKIWLKDGSDTKDPRSVQGVLEMGLCKLKSVNYPNVVLSSRTDGGVHALSTTAHVDLTRYGRRTYPTEEIAKSLNNHFNRNQISILINHVQHVPDTFHARFSALSRTYLYRFATIKKGVERDQSTHFCSYFPVEEWRRCLFIGNPNFDIEKFKQGAALLPGLHDWGSFKKFDNRPKPHKHDRRTLYSLDVRPGRSSILLESRKEQDIFDYWEVECRGKGFVHNQVRRIIGLLKAVAEDKVPLDEITVMLQVPSKHSWPTHASTAPPHALYLCNVEYDPVDFEFGRPSSTSEVRRDEESDDD